MQRSKKRHHRATSKCNFASDTPRFAPATERGHSVSWIELSLLAACRQWGQPVWKQSEICGAGGFRLGRSCLRILRPGGFGGLAMHRFIDGGDRMQQALLPHSLEDYGDEGNPVREIEVFIDEPDLAPVGFSGLTP